MKWGAPASTRERSRNIESFQMVELPRACTEEHDKYDTKQAGKGPCKEQSLSLSPKTSLRMISTVASQEILTGRSPSFVMVLQAILLPAACAVAVTRNAMSPQCDTHYRERRSSESDERYVWGVANRSSSGSLAARNSVHVKCCKYRETIQPRPRGTLKCHRVGKLILNFFL